MPAKIVALGISLRTWREASRGFDHDAEAAERLIQCPGAIQHLGARAGRSGVTGPAEGGEAVRRPAPERCHRARPFLLDLRVGYRREADRSYDGRFAAGKGAPGRAQLYIDGQLAGQAEFPVTTPIAFNPGGLTCGANPGSPVVPDYRSPFRFSGTLHAVTVDLSGELISDTEGEMRMAMSRQ